MNARVKTAVEAIYALQDIDELRGIYDAITLKQNALAREGIRSVVKGDVVSFTDRRGVKIVGKVTKVNRKTVMVLGGMSNGVFNTTYKVPASMIKVEEKV
jgi:hypothetical protein